MSGISVSLVLLQRRVFLRDRNRVHAEGFQRGRTRAMLPKTDFPNRVCYRARVRSEEDLPSSNLVATATDPGWGGSTSAHASDRDDCLTLKYKLTSGTRLNEFCWNNLLFETGCTKIRQASTVSTCCDCDDANALTAPP
jgi:hypothetical protein